MHRLTVSEYAREVQISVQTVYRKVKQGELNSVKQNGKVYIIHPVNKGNKEVEDVKQDVKHTSNNVKQELNTMLNLIKSQQKEIKRLSKEIKRLTKELTKAQNGKSEVLEKFIFEMQRLSYQPSENDEDIIDVKEKKKGKKKKKKKGKK